MGMEGKWSSAATGPIYFDTIGNFGRFQGRNQEGCILGIVCKSAKVTDWWLRRQRQKFFLLFLGDHLRAQNHASYFSVSDFEDGCTWLHLLLARLLLPDHSNLLVQVLPAWTSVTQHFLVLTKRESAIGSSLTEMKVEFEWKEPFLSRAQARGGRCWWCPG